MRLLLLVAAVYVLLNDNIYPGMEFIDRVKPASPYGVRFLQRYKEAGKNLLAEKILLPRPRTQLSKGAVFQAEQAWQYFHNNLNRNTGMVNTLDNYPVASAWDIASSLSALHAARTLGIIGKPTFDQVVQRLLNTLLTMDMVDGRIPNRYYSTRDARMVGFTNKEGAVGYSPIDLGRLLGWLHIFKQNYPEYASDIDKFALRINYCSLIDAGELFGGVVDRAGEIRVAQQGRLGYEEYAAKGFYLWGFDTTAASKIEPLEWVEVAGQKIPVDQRDLLNPLEKSFVIPDSYMLNGLEYHWDQPDDTHTTPEVHSDVFAFDTSSRIYNAQRLRFEATGLLTARSELQLAQAPYFVYDSIFANGKPWHTIDDLGRALSSRTALSTRAVFSMWALWETPYTELLFSRVANLYAPGKGYYEGVYESGEIIPSHSANTNAIVLASLAFVAKGKPLVAAHGSGLWEFALKQTIEKRSNPSCYPLMHVCEKDCDQLASISEHGIRAKKLREVEARLMKLESSREEVLKPFEIVQ